MGILYIPCPLCGRESVEGRVCAPCRLRNDPTPVSEYVETSGETLVEIAFAADVSARTMKRALHGEPLSAEAAVRISSVTGIDASILRAGVERTDDG